MTAEDPRSQVIDVLRRHGSSTRGELAELTGLSRSTITAFVSSLQTEGLLVERAADDRDGAGPGRPPARLGLRPEAGAVVGVHVGRKQLRVAVADLAATVLAERVSRGVDDPETTFDAAAAAVSEMLTEAGLSSDSVVGAGVGVAGPVDPRTGAIRVGSLAPAWSDVCVGAELEHRLGLPVLVSNDSNLGALAEVTLGAWRGREDVVFIAIGDGIGAGMVLGGRLHSGATGIAGELGHVQVEAGGRLCRCGKRGCLGTVAATSPLLELLRPTHGDIAVADLVDLVASDDPGACRVLTDAGRVVGRVLGELCNIVNPSIILVGGELSVVGEPLVKGIEDGIERFAIPGSAIDVTVARASLGDRAPLLGAIALALTDTDRTRSPLSTAR
jgi:predicted NBD/HSP70 family sugar kinase